MNIPPSLLPSPPLVDALGWTLVHSVWQGAAVLVLLRVALILLRGRSPNARYLAATCALALMLVLPLLTFVAGAVRTSAPAVARGATAKAADARSAPRRPTFDAPAPAPAASVAFGAPLPVASHAAEPVLSRAALALESRLPWLTAAWCVGVLAVGVWHLGGWLATQRLRAVGVSPAHETMRAAARQLATRLGVRRPVRLLESALVRSPVVFGWLRPVILLPAAVASGLSAAQLEAILAHELAHVRRHDYLVNLLQCVVETLLFYHPAAWWASAVVREEREHCCDDLVLSLGVERFTYAASLVQVLEPGPISRGTVPATALAATARPSQLRRRLMRMLPGQGPERPTRSGRWVGALAAVFLLVLAGFLRLSTAADTGAASTAAKSPQEGLAPASGEHHKPAAQTAEARAPADHAAAVAASREKTREHVRRGFEEHAGGLFVFLSQRPQIYVMDLDGRAPMDIGMPGRPLIDEPDTKFDVAFGTRLDAKGFIRRDLVVVPVERGDWETMSSAAVHARLAGQEPGNGEYAVDWVTLPKVFAFRSREGREGLLRIDWFKKQEGSQTQVGWYVEALKIAGPAAAAADGAPPREAVRVMLVTEGNFSLEKALEALKEIAATPVKPAELARGGADPDEHAVVLFDRHRPQKRPARSHVLSFGTVPPGSGLRAPAELRKGVSVTGWKRDHPVMRGLDMSKLDVGEALKLDVPEGEGWEVLVEAADGPLIVAREAGGRREVVVAFDVNESTWPLNRTFPLFLHQCLAWLAAGEAPATRPKAATNAEPPLNKTERKLVGQWAGEGMVPALYAFADGRHFEVSGLGETVASGRWHARDHRDLELTVDEGKGPGWKVGSVQVRRIQRLDESSLVVNVVEDGVAKGQSGFRRVKQHDAAAPAPPEKDAPPGPEDKEAKNGKADEAPAGRDENGAPAGPAPAPAARSLEDLASVELAKTHGLSDGQVFRIVDPPFAEARAAWVKLGDPSSPRSGSVGPLFFTWRDGRLRQVGGSNGADVTAAEVVHDAMGLDWYQVEGLDKVGWPAVRGDVVVREDATPQDKLAALAAWIRAQTGRSLRVTSRPVKRACVVLRGGGTTSPGYPYVNADERGGFAAFVTGEPLGDADLAQRAARLNRWGQMGGPAGWGKFRRDALSGHLGAPVLAGVPCGVGGPDDGEQGLFWRTNLFFIGDDVVSMRPTDDGYAAKLRRVLDNIQKQLGGDWRVEERDVPTFTIAPEVAVR